MKITSKLIVAFVALFYLASCGGPGENRAEIMERLEAGEIPEAVDVYRISAEASTIAWVGTKIGGAHDGTIAVDHGELYVFDGELLAGEVVVDMQQIVVLDIEDPGSNARLKAHLESDDFFSVETFPSAFFEITAVEAVEVPVPGEKTHRVFGNMTIKGITHGIAFDALIETGEDSLLAYADFTLDRTRWDVRFGSGRFFENLGDNLIHDDFRLTLDIIARK